MVDIIQKIKNEYRKNKIVTLFMGTVILLSLLSYLKPGSTDSILQYVGISAINMIILSIFLVIIWYFWWRKRKQ